MRLVALISGGKDSLFNMLQCISAGHEIVAVANIEPETKEEIDSYMYQSVGHEAVSLIAVALALPIYRQKTKGKAFCKSKTYTKTNQDEVEDLLQLLQKVKKDMHIEGVSVGAIASDYQRTRVENVCGRLGLKCFAYLWKRNQAELLQEMIDADLDAIIIKVASIGLNPEAHLGMHIRDMKTHLVELNTKYGVNICGEGGEYETLTVDCPLFHRKVNILESENLILSNDAFAPVAFLNVKNAVLKPKFWGTDDPVESLQTRLSYIKSVVKDPYCYIEDCVDEISLNIFPQHQRAIKHDELPFPFETKSKDEPTASVSQYWKQFTVQSQQSSSTQKLPASSSILLSLDTAICNLNYSTGWCSIGNILGCNFQDAFLCLQKHLERTRYGFQDIVFVNIFIRDMSDFSNLNKIYSQNMPEFLPPARVCVATQLPADMNILIAVVAHKLVSRSQKVLSNSCISDKDVLHVQSISHWAPANIGPYSQCVRVGGIYYLAGQIPLIPGTMEILNKPFYHQNRLTLRHILRVLQAMNENFDFSNVLLAVCYITAEEIACDIPSLWSYITKNECTPVAVVVVTELPKNAQLEWEVVACGFENPTVFEGVEIIDEYSVHIKRCCYEEPYASSFVCKVISSKRTNEKKIVNVVPLDVLKSIVTHCLCFIQKEVKNIGLHLCILKLFYRCHCSKSGTVISELLKNFSCDHKVVISGIPVLAFQESNIFLTITGLCH